MITLVAFTFIRAAASCICEFTYKKRLNLGAEINFANSTALGACSAAEFHTADLWARVDSFSTSVAESACVCELDPNGLLLKAARHYTL
jgi:hypothetical protein